jgi:hypothetical protein
MGKQVKVFELNIVQGWTLLIYKQSGWMNNKKGRNNAAFF